MGLQFLVRANEQKRDAKITLEEAEERNERGHAEVLMEIGAGNNLCASFNKMFERLIEKN